MQGYLNLKGYGEFDAANRPSGWNTWLTFSISPAAASTVTPTKHLVTLNKPLPPVDRELRSEPDRVGFGHTVAH